MLTLSMKVTHASIHPGRALNSKEVLSVKWSKIIAYPQRDKVTIVLVIVVALCATPTEASWTLR